MSYETLEQAQAAIDGYVKRLAANVKEIRELEEGLVHEKESHAATTRTWESRERHCGLLATQLKQAQAACAELRYCAFDLTHKPNCAIQDPSEPHCDCGCQQEIDHAQSSECGKGWISPDEAKRLEAQCAILRNTVEVIGSQNHNLECPNCRVCEEVDKALKTDAGTDLLARLERYERVLLFGRDECDDERMCKACREALKGDKP